MLQHFREGILRVDGQSTMEMYTAIWITDEESWERPNDFKTTKVLDWQANDIDIPWPEGMTAKEAILAWARKEDEDSGYPWAF